MYRPILIAALLAAPTLVAAQAVQPGMWEIETTIVAADMPGPPGLGDRLKGRKQSARRCLTAAEAAKGPQEMMKSSQGCKMTRYTRKAGKIDGEMVCKDAAGTLTATTTGDYTASSFTTTAKMARSGAQRMSMTVRTAGKRTGPCSK